MISGEFGSITRKTLISLLIIVSGAILGFRLFQMQILNRHSYENKSAENSIKSIEQLPLRGVMYDRNMNLLVNNVPAYTLRITPAEYDKKLNHLLESVLEVDSGYIDKILRQYKSFSKFQPIKIKRGVPFKTIAWVEENSENLPGVDYLVEMHRDYPAGVNGSHIFGYTKEISQKLLKKRKEYYNLGDYIGYSGIEKTYENELRGKKGWKYILVDSRRREISKYKDGKQDLPSVKGYDLVLSIDADAQKVAEHEFTGKRGALVAIEPKTGEVLALVSAPEYDLSKFSYITSKEFLTKLYNDPSKPLFNRATMSVKPPGSTYKILAAIAGLDLGVISTSTTFYCGGGLDLGRFFKCHGVHGNLNVIHAIEKSCNTFFYNLIFKIGLDRWYDYSRRFGFGIKTGIDIDEESAGLIPNSKYYEKIYGKDWPTSIMASLVIGQGETSVTPLQLAQYTAMIANDGVTYKPHVVKGYLDNKSKEFIPLTSKKIDTGIDKKIFDIVKEGMYLVVNGEGTATWIKSDKYTIAGKTGTAQNPHGKDHAWFIAFAPFENPQIAVAVLVENVGFGSTYAAPIAKKVIETYLNGLKDNSQKIDNPMAELKK